VTKKKRRPAGSLEKVEKNGRLFEATMSPARVDGGGEGKNVSEDEGVTRGRQATLRPRR